MTERRRPDVTKSIHLTRPRGGMEIPAVAAEEDPAGTMVVTLDDDERVVAIQAAEEAISRDLGQRVVTTTSYCPTSAELKILARVNVLKEHRSMWVNRAVDLAYHAAYQALRTHRGRN